MAMLRGELWFGCRRRLGWVMLISSVISSCMSNANCWRQNRYGTTRTWLATKSWLRKKRTDSTTRLAQLVCTLPNSAADSRAPEMVAWREVKGPDRELRRRQRAETPRHLELDCLIRARRRDADHDLEHVTGIEALLQTNPLGSTIIVHVDP